MRLIRLASPVPMLAALLLSACGGARSDEPLGQTPVSVLQSAKPYDVVAACSFGRLNTQQGSAVHKADLPTEGKIIVSIDTGPVKYFEATFRRVSGNQTAIDITSARTMWGPFPVEKMIAEVRACSSG